MQSTIIYQIIHVQCDVKYKDTEVFFVYSTIMAKRQYCKILITDNLHNLCSSESVIFLSWPF